MEDMVKNPPHYMHASGVETKEIVYPLPMWLGSSIKYAMRRDKKGKPIEDRRKAIETLCGEEMVERLLQVYVPNPEITIHKARQVAKYELDKDDPDLVILCYMSAVDRLLDRLDGNVRHARLYLESAKSLLEDEIERLAETN